MSDNNETTSGVNDGTNDSPFWIDEPQPGKEGE